MKLVFNFLTEDSKESYAYTFRQCGDLFCICAAAGGTGDGRVTVVGSDIALALFLKFLVVLFFFALALVELGFAEAWVIKDIFLANVFSCHDAHLIKITFGLFCEIFLLSFFR